MIDHAMKVVKSVRMETRVSGLRSIQCVFLSDRG